MDRSWDQLWIVHLWRCSDYGGGILWHLYSAAPLGNQAACTMTCYPTQSHVPDTDLTGTGDMLYINAELQARISFVCLLLFYVIVFQLHHGGDMMHEIRRRKSEPTLLLTQEIFNLQCHICIVWEELAFDDTASYYAVGKWIAVQLNVRAVMGFPRVTNHNQLSYLPTPPRTDRKVPVQLWVA